jgi:hypothetical protein
MAAAAAVSAAATRLAFPALAERLEPPSPFNEFRIASAGARCWFSVAPTARSGPGARAWVPDSFACWARAVHAPRSTDPANGAWQIIATSPTAVGTTYATNRLPAGAHVYCRPLAPATRAADVDVEFP